MPVCTRPVSGAGCIRSGIRDSLDAINGIGHAAVTTDPQFRAALAAHGFTLDPYGEIDQLAPFTGAFSARAAQIAGNIERYETDWQTAHPGQTAGPGLRQAWDSRAWANARPDKVTPVPGSELNSRWLAELAALGYRDQDRPVTPNPASAGSLDRELGVAQSDRAAVLRTDAPSVARPQVADYARTSHWQIGRWS